METGFLLINKPKDWTSHDVVAYTRGIVREYYKDRGLPAEARRAKVGHAGTLDPFATGLLIVAVGREATKRIDEFKALPKTYVADIHLGATSDTYDVTGTIQASASDLQTTQKQIDEALKSFIGKQQQTPPMYSAKKIGGKKLYDLARKGIEVKRKPCDIEIFDIALLRVIASAAKQSRDCHVATAPRNDAAGQLITIMCQVSTGTYIRTLAHDIGHKLGTGAYCETLERTAIGEHLLENAIGPKELTKENWQNRLF